MRRLIVALLLMVISVSCGNARNGESTREIVGVVVEIRSGTGFGEVESFTVKDGQQEYEIFVDPDVTYDFPLAHLNSHRAGAEPVRVEAKSRNAKLVALEIGDA